MGMKVLELTFNFGRNFLKLYTFFLLFATGSGLGRQAYWAVWFDC